ncbi:MBL fold metallo-hydrolase [Vespertiliibacter pulmonis]|uniref:Glyoxylase-like metal-dependent hydrolase (Beta-lactamase superfamily II) n=1 Tax=Vespertiliibacter pulmonis TaxID=1443036 RepID=A0A3N4VKQ9_9PAST|nr:MBL fold metallo-hydrolase [Vespertiliibacter pulmonis]QLB21663.1 MBL fold metallo-hydrolase [Vespertiliibacter pulmonis]RPE83696.1 glyoxylase-like metal-dependent hydrolase (beta-lactamase superfamily II) [Vespertiliibacter pulmonis]
MFNLQIIPVTAFQQNCSIIWDSNKNAAIIDPGGDSQKMIEFVQLQELNVQKILITHGHLDHIMAVETLKHYFGVPAYGSHYADKMLFEQLPEICRNYSFPEVPAFLPDHWLEENDEVKVGDITFTIRHLPGHSPGHIGFFDFKNKIVFSGDVLFQNSIGRTDLHQGNFDQLIHSIRTKLFDLDDDFVIIPGHGSHTTIGQEKKSNPFLK